MLVLLGAPRSGTTFIQRELSSYPGVVTTTELHYFSHFASPALRRFEKQVVTLNNLGSAFDRSGAMENRAITLPAVMEYDEFLSFLRKPLDQLCERALRDYDDTSVFMMKNPTDAIFSQDVAAIVPDAHWINVIRSPHDVVKSYRSINGNWGGSWAPKSVVLGCLLWRMCVLGALQLEERPNYMNLRYEDVRGNPTTTLRTVLDHIGLDDVSQSDGPVPAKWLTSTLSERLHGDVGPIEPKNFGDGSVARPKLNAVQAKLVTMLCRDLMARFDYLPEGAPTQLSPLVRTLLHLTETLYNKKLRRDLKKSFRAKATQVSLV